MTLITLLSSRLSIVAAALLILSGCGQKGPLYLPQDDSANTVIETPADTNDNSAS